MITQVYLETENLGVTWISNRAEDAKLTEALRCKTCAAKGS